MVTLKMGVTDKKVNSTKQTFTLYDNVSAALKNKVSIKTPSFILNRSNLSRDISEYNYIQWDSRYYWITNIAYINNKHIEIQANLDLLATYKDALLHASFYCKYTNNPNAYNTEIDDTRLNPEFLKSVDPIDTSLYKTANVFGGKADLWLDYDSSSMNLNDGIIVMQTQSIVGTKSYILSVSQFSTWMTGMHNAGSSVIELIAGFFGYESWTQCINSCIWYPISYNKFKEYYVTSLTPSVTASKLYIGGVACDGVWGPDIDCYVAPWLWVEHFSGRIQIPRLLDAPYFMWYNRWCTYQLQTPFGVQDLNGDFCAYGHSYIPFHTTWDPASGQLNIKYTYDGVGFDDGTQTVALSTQGNIGTDILHLVQTMQSWDEKLMTTVDLGLIAGGAVAAGGLIAGAGSIGSGIGKAAASGAKHQQLMQDTISRAENSDTAESILNTPPAMPQDVEQAKNSGISVGPMIVNGITSAVRQSQAGPNGSSGTGLAGLFNTTKLGLTKIRRKQFTCTELEHVGATPQQRYDRFCADFGYPCNEQIDIYNLKYLIYPRKEKLFVQGSIIVHAGILGCTAPEVNALEQMVANGIWYED